MKRALPIICIVSLIIGCSVAPTKPNISALYRVPSLYTQLPLLPAESKQLTRQPLPAEAQTLFQRLCALDPALALEVGKIPEFQGIVGEKEILSLTRFTDLIANASYEEKAKLAELLEVGKPDFRRYCAPLQAVFWLLEEDECLLKPNPLHYPLETILNYAWDFTDQDRWVDYQVVTDRLNSPRLLNFYEKRNFMYVSHGVCSGNAKSIFIYKRGCCSDYTAFSEYCLQKAGYHAIAIKVVSPTGKKYHVVCEYKDKDGKEYIMDVDCYSCTGGRGILEKKEYLKKLPQIGYGYI